MSTGLRAGGPGGFAFGLKAGDVPEFSPRIHRRERSCAGFGMLSPHFAKMIKMIK